jgi:Na+/proline symporter
MNFFCFVMPCVISIPIAARWWRTRVTTVPEFLNRRFGPSTRYFFAIIGVPSRILDNGNRMYTTAVFVGVALGIGKGLGLWGSSFIIVAYTFLGGIWAVMATDTIQFFLMTIAVMIVGALGLHYIGGFSSFFHNAPDKFWSLNPDSEFTVGFAIAIAMITFVNMNGYWALIQRYTSTPSERETRKVPLLSGLAFLVVMPILYAPAMVAAQAIPEAIQALVDGGLPLKIASERSYVLLCMKMLPAGIMGLMVVSIFSATMSALSSEYNIIAAVCTKDIYQGLIKKDKPVSDKKLLWWGRFTTIAVAFACTFMGSHVDKLGGSFKYLFVVLGLTSIPTYLPPLVGLYYRRTPAWGANLAFILGLTSGCIAKFAFQAPLLNVVIVNTSVTLLTVLISGLIDPPTGERKKRIDELFDQISKPDTGKAAVKPDTPGEKIKSGPDIEKVIAVGCGVFAVFLFIAALATKGAGGFIPNIICATGLGGICAVLLYKSK